MSAATTSLTYDYENRVTGITYPSSATNSFSYNGEDLRVGKTDSSGTSSVVTDGTAVASPVLKDSRAVYTPGLSEHTTGTGGASKFYHTDALGSTRGITNSSQSVTDSTLFDAFGMTVSHSGTTATPFGFVGGSQYQTDNDSGLMLLGHRYYDASIGRFISSDPIQDGDNWYSYCDNNPLVENDGDGLSGDGLPGLPPDRNINPRGQLRRHFPRAPTKKAAEDSAQNRGHGRKPELDVNDKLGSDPHFHPVGSNGQRLPGIHVMYPRKGYAVPKGQDQPDVDPWAYASSPDDFRPYMPTYFDPRAAGEAAGILLGTGLALGFPEVAIPVLIGGAASAH